MLDGSATAASDSGRGTGTGAGTKPPLGPEVSTLLPLSGASHGAGALGEGSAVRTPGLSPTVCLDDDAQDFVDRGDPEEHLAETVVAQRHHAFGGGDGLDLRRGGVLDGEPL